MKRIARAAALYRESTGQAIQGLHVAACSATNTGSSWTASGSFSATAVLILHGFLALRHTYSSGVFSGFAAALVGDTVRLGLCISVANKSDSKLYKLKTTFLRTFPVLGAKPIQL